MHEVNKYSGGQIKPAIPSMAKTVIRKLLTRPIWWWERKRKYSIRNRYLALPSLAVGDRFRRFVVLTTPMNLKDALWSAWSWYRYLQARDFRLELAVDGTLDDSATAEAKRLFPGVPIYEVRPRMAALCMSRPSLAEFLQNYSLGRKLGLLLALTQSDAVLYSDHDVLAFDFPEELLSLVENNIPCYIQEEGRSSYDSEILERGKHLGLECPPKLNSGLLYIPRNSLSIDVAEQLLTTWRPPGKSWFTEQTVMGILMGNARARPLPADRYLVSARRQFYWQKDVDYRTIVARHFTGTVRHLMYGAGMPAIWSQSKLANGA